MSEPIRHRIVEVLASGSHTAGELAQVIGVEFGVTRRAVSWHLAILLDANWLFLREDGATHHYALAPDALTSLREDLEWLEQIWERRIGWLADNDTHPRLAQQPTRGHGRGARGRRDDDPWRVTSSTP